jgi:hypothetical protein
VSLFAPPCRHVSIVLPISLEIIFIVTDSHFYSTKPHLRDARTRSASLPPSYRLGMGLPAIPEEEEEEMPVIRHGRPRAYTTIATRPTLQGITC